MCVYSEEIDSDDDGLTDTILLEASMPLLPTETIYACTMLVFLEYRLNVNYQPQPNLHLHPNPSPKP